MQLIHGDCLEKMKDISDGSIDMVLADIPYGTTACKWDSILPLEPMWKQLKRVIKEHGAIVLFGSEPFSSKLRLSNLKMYKYDWVWNKKQSGNPFLVKKQPLKIYENIIVFGDGRVNYYPQMRKGKMRKKSGYQKEYSELYGKQKHYEVFNDEYYPVAILEFANCSNKKDRLHPTQKPVKLMEYLIKTYTNEGETVLDFTAGSFTTGIACINLNRDFIGIEKDEKYFKIGKDRIEKHIAMLKEIE